MITTKSFDMDERAMAAFATLRKVFGVTNDAEVLERALGLAQVAGEVAGEERIVTLDGAAGKQSVALDR